MGAYSVYWLKCGELVVSKAPLHVWPLISSTHNQQQLVKVLTQTVSPFWIVLSTHHVINFTAFLLLHIDAIWRWTEWVYKRMCRQFHSYQVNELITTIIIYWSVTCVHADYHDSPKYVWKEPKLVCLFQSCVSWAVWVLLQIYRCIFTGSHTTQPQGNNNTRIQLSFPLAFSCLFWASKS